MPIPQPTIHADILATMFESCQITAAKRAETESMVDRILAGRGKYAQVAAACGVPWFFVACLHARESDCDFGAHLHNGDPLSSRTVHVPSGRPKVGEPPFSWQESAIDALRYERYTSLGEPAIGDLLWLCEKYNGVGYCKRNVPSPYLWSGTDKYKAGKYVADGQYDPSAVDAQVGVVPLLLRLYERGAIMLRGNPLLVTIAEKNTQIEAFVLRGKSFIAARTAATLGGTIAVSGAIVEVRQTPIAEAVSLPLHITGNTGYVGAAELGAAIGRTVTYQPAGADASGGHLSAKLAIG